MREQEYTSEYINKSLTFKDCEILNININYPRFDFKSGKKINKFYAVTAKAFLKFCEKKLYKNAAEIFLLCEAEQERFKIFCADIKFEIKNERELIKIYLDININGEKTRRLNIWNLSGELIKPPETKKKRFRSIAT
jgi:hypothetical protein